MSLLSFLEENMLSCQWKQQFDIECMGCGMQRSIIHLLKGEFVEAFYMYPAIYTLIAMFAFLLLHLKFSFKKGHKILLYLFITNLVLMLSNYFLKIF
ncbi:MAG: DUF2752 domain-containing protein [Flavobacteriaceae bacterium]|nr:DUF2752 domain-containing protein [Flavobacteriaceae bacterium]